MYNFWMLHLVVPEVTSRLWKIKQPPCFLHGTIGILIYHSDEPLAFKACQYVYVSPIPITFAICTPPPHNSDQEFHRRFHLLAGYRGGKAVKPTRGRAFFRQVHLKLSPLLATFSRIWKLSLCLEHAHQGDFIWICNSSCRIGVRTCIAQEHVMSQWRFHCAWRLTDRITSPKSRVLAACPAAICYATSWSTASDKRYGPDKLRALYVDTKNLEEHTASIFRTQSFNPEDGGVTFFRNICTHPAHHMCRNSEEHKINLDFHLSWTHAVFETTSSNESLICRRTRVTNMETSAFSKSTVQHAWVQCSARPAGAWVYSYLRIEKFVILVSAVSLLPLTHVLCEIKDSSTLHTTDKIQNGTVKGTRT
jgi:hypothetical protein